MRLLPTLSALMIVTVSILPACTSKGAIHRRPGPCPSSGVSAGDECITDNDCPSNQACSCAGESARNPIVPAFAVNGATEVNRCVPADCRTDPDCAFGEGFCAPASNRECYSKVDAYRCHTPGIDECSQDSDCSGWFGTSAIPFCQYGALNRWWCTTASCDLN